MRNRLNNEQNAFDSLEDAIESYFESGENDLYEDYIDSMPNTRESVNELLNACSSYDLLGIYTKLLTDFSDLLDVEERDKLKMNYKETFSVPLPGDIE